MIRTLVSALQCRFLCVFRILPYAHSAKPVWLCSMDEFLKVIRLLKGQQLEVLRYVLLHTQVDNTFCTSAHEVATAIGLEGETVQMTFQRLEKCCFWFTLKDGRWLVNGNMLLFLELETNAIIK